MNRTVIQQELFERLEAIERSLNKRFHFRMQHFTKIALTVVWRRREERVRNG